MTDRPDLDRLEALASACPTEPWEYHGSSIWTDEGEYSWVAEVQSDDIAAFMLAARDAVPALCAYVREVVAERDKLRRMVEAVEAMCPTEEPIRPKDIDRRTRESKRILREYYKQWQAWHLRQAMHAASTPAVRDETDSEATEDCK